MGLAMKRETSQIRRVRRELLRNRWKGLLVLSSAVILTGCTSGGEGGRVATLSGPGSGPSRLRPSVDPEEASLAWAQCMREQGVPVADPGSGDGVQIPQGVSQGRWGEAGRACHHLLPNGGWEGPDPEWARLSPGEQAREFDRLLRFSRCMREQGIDFPDPEYSGGAGIVIEPGPDIDLTDRNVREATARCAPFGGTS
jgi:hypothetical protein